MYGLNIAGSEWVIIIFVALVLILGTGRLPGAARKLGKAVNSYNKARDEIRDGLEGAAPPGITGPVGSEREKLEAMARAAGIVPDGKTDEELRGAISDRFKRRDPESGVKQ